MAWFVEEYEPVIELLREADLIGRATETEAYMRVATLRYLVLRTHEWDDAIVEAIRRDLQQPGLDDDTMVRNLRRELK